MLTIFNRRELLLTQRNGRRRFAIFWLQMGLLIQ